MLSGREVRVGPGGSASCLGDAQVSRAPAVWAASFLGGRVRASPRALGGLSRRRGHSQCEHHKGNPPVPHTRLAAAPARCLATDANRTTSTALGAAVRRRGAPPTRPAVVKPTALGDGVGSKSGSVPGRWVTASGGRGRSTALGRRAPAPWPLSSAPLPLPLPLSLPSPFPLSARRRRCAAEKFFFGVGSSRIGVGSSRAGRRVPGDVRDGVGWRRADGVGSKSGPGPGRWVPSGYVRRDVGWRGVRCRQRGVRTGCPAREKWMGRGLRALHHGHREGAYIPTRW